MYGPAPHKLILLLAVMREIEAGRIVENRILPTAELMESFSTIWSVEVRTGHKPNFALPFFHLRGDGFWHLVAHPGMEDRLNSCREINTLNALRQTIQYARLDSNLFDLLKDAAERRILSDELLSILWK